MIEDGRDYPDGLTPAERRVLDYVRALTLDAEIAVRLGVPVGDVKERIASILRKLDLHDRASLVTWVAPAPVEAPASGAAEAPGDGADALADQTAARRFTRRRLVTGAGALGVLAAGGAATALLVRRDEPSPAAPVSAATKPPSMRALSELMEPVDNAFESREFAPGEPIDWRHGVFTMDVETGVVYGWRLSDAALTGRAWRWATG